MQITPLFLRAISIDTPDNVLASTIELIHEDTGPSFVRKGENAKPKLTKAGTPTTVLLIHNHCVRVRDDLRLYYSIQTAHRRPVETCQFPQEAWFRCQAKQGQLEVYRQDHQDQKICTFSYLVIIAYAYATISLTLLRHRTPFSRLRNRRSSMP